MKIKLCGLRRELDAEFINEFKPDYVGFILSSGYKRSISFDEFLSISKRINKSVKSVGVFVNESLENIFKYIPHLDCIQLHGEESKDYINAIKEKSSIKILKAVRAKSVLDIELADKLPCDCLLLDSFSPNMVGGTGKVANLCIIESAKITKPFFIAGGIDCDNVLNIIKKLNPMGVDISSSIETDGYKDREKIKKLLDIIRSNNNE